MSYKIKIFSYHFHRVDMLLQEFLQLIESVPSLLGVVYQIQYRGNSLLLSTRREKNLVLVREVAGVCEI